MLDYSVQFRTHPSEAPVPEVPSCHHLAPVDDFREGHFGGGQIILRDPETGVLTAGSDSRKDGCAVGW